jgi:hypothetical protein
MSVHLFNEDALALDVVDEFANEARSIWLADILCLHVASLND